MIPPVDVPSAAHPGTGMPGLGVPLAAALAETADGGVFVSGVYPFNRAIQCGSQLDPSDPVTGSCGSSVRNGMVARLDAAGKLLWAKRLGVVYNTGAVVFEHNAALSDGSVLSVGWLIPEREGLNPLHMQALAARYDTGGGLVWAKAFPWGPAPGATFFQMTSFIGAADWFNGVSGPGRSDLVSMALIGVPRVRRSRGNAPRGNPARAGRRGPSSDVIEIHLALDEHPPSEGR